jgi:hypothetical protein
MIHRPTQKELRLFLILKLLLAAIMFLGLLSIYLLASSLFKMPVNPATWTMFMVGMLLWLKLYEGVKISVN